MSKKGRFEFVCFQGALEVFPTHVIALGRHLVPTLAPESQTPKSENQTGRSAKLGALYVRSRLPELNIILQSLSKARLNSACPIFHNSHFNYISNRCNFGN